MGPSCLSNRKRSCGPRQRTRAERCGIHHILRQILSPPKKCRLRVRKPLRPTESIRRYPSTEGGDAGGAGSGPTGSRRKHPPTQGVRLRGKRSGACVLRSLTVLDDEGTCGRFQVDRPLNACMSACGGMPRYPDDAGVSFTVPVRFASLRGCRIGKRNRSVPVASFGARQEDDVQGFERQEASLTLST